MKTPKPKQRELIYSIVSIDIEDLIDWTREDFIDYLATDIDEYLNMNIDYRIIRASGRTITLRVSGEPYPEDS